MRDRIAIVVLSLGIGLTILLAVNLFYAALRIAVGT